ncbi:MAG: DMT family transporter [Chloroflexota bacterium]
MSTSLRTIGQTMGQTVGKVSETVTDGFLFLLLANICLSTVPIAVKIGLTPDTSVFALLVFRVLLASLMLWVYFLAFKRDTIRFDQAGLFSCLLAAIANCFSMFCNFMAISYIDASLMVIVNTTTFIAVVILLLMMQGEQPSRLDLIRFLIGSVGVYLFVGVLGELHWLGILLAMATAFFYGIHVTIIQVRLSAYDSQGVTLYVITFMTLILGSIYLALGSRWPTFGPVTWGALLWLALVATGMARIFLFIGIKRAGSRQAALLMPFGTLLTVGLATWLLNESVTLQQWLGTVLVVVSVALGARAKKRA